MDKYYVARSDERKRHFARVDESGKIHYTGYAYGFSTAKRNSRVIENEVIKVTKTGWKEVTEDDYANKIIDADRFYRLLTGQLKEAKV